MFAINSSHREQLRQWSPTLLYVAGGLFLLILMQNFVDFRIPFTTFLGPLSSILAIIGVIGLYPTLSEQVPSLSKIGVICLAVAVIVIAVGFALNQLIKLNPEQILIPIYLVSSISYAHLSLVSVGYLLFAVATFRANSYPRILGHLLSVPVILTAIEIVIIIFQVHGNAVSWLLRTLVLIQTLDYLVMGYIISKTHEVTYPQINTLWSRVSKLFNPVP